MVHNMHLIIYQTQSENCNLKYSINQNQISTKGITYVSIIMQATHVVVISEEQRER
jgi:hypothetical protein